MDKLMQWFEYPSSALLAASFLLAVFAVHRYAAPDSRVVGLFTGRRMAMTLLVAGALLLAIEGSVPVGIHRSALMTAYLLVLQFSLLLTVLKGFRRRARAGFLLNHLGLFLIVWASCFGAPDVHRSKLIIGRGEAVGMSFTPDGMAVPLPFSVALEDFWIDYYADGVSPRQYTSTLVADGKRMDVSVNHPCSYKGYVFYQENYDHVSNSYSVLQVVRNPWLPVVYAGMVLLAIGAVLLLYGRWKARLTIPVTLLLTVAFTLLTIGKINFGTLMPALRSWWFVPHLFIYMVAYSLMAMALPVIFWEKWRNGRMGNETSDKLVRSSSALLVIGILTGSVWAEQAWGDYWAWDAKENWAAVTWFVSLMFLHLRHRQSWRAAIVVLLAFLALQITWYGVSYLPSARTSLHIYNS